MFSLDVTDIQRLAVSSVGAILLSTACIVGAVGPAKAATPEIASAPTPNSPLTMADWRDVVEDQIARRPTVTTTGRMLTGRTDTPAVATVRVRFDADGAFDKATLATSTGDLTFDRDAIRTAETIRYPALPAGLRGKPQTIAVQLVYGVAHSQVEAARLHDIATKYAKAADQNGVDADATRTADLRGE